FVLLHSAGAHTLAEAHVLTPYSPICLTVRGTRISNFGPPVYQNVTGSVCGFTRVPILGGILAASSAAVPMVAVTHPGPQGEAVVAGHTAAEVNRTGSGNPNLIVHFADSKSIGQLRLLTEALERSNRKNAAAAIVAVLMPDQLSKASYTPGIV